MAELILRKMLVDRGMDGQIKVRSGALSNHSRDGCTVSLDAQIILKAEGIAVPEDFRSTDVGRHREVVAEADLILTFTALQKQRVEALEEARGKAVHIIREFVGETGDIADPEGYADADYLKTKRQIDYCLGKVLDILAPVDGKGTA